MERALRDKVAALNDLENAKLQIKRYDQEVSLVGIPYFEKHIQNKKEKKKKKKKKLFHYNSAKEHFSCAVVFLS